jgi:hypothetical protein
MLPRRLGIAVLVSLAACGPHHTGDGNGTGSDAAVADGTPAPVIDAFAGPYADFPAQPIIDGSDTPATGSTLFGAAGTGSATGGPCLIEPELGTLFPNNWLRPRFTWVPTGSESLFELTLTTPNEVSPLVVYTTASTWTMPADLWALVSTHIVDQPITVTVRGATYDATTMALTSGPEVGSTGPISIAPASAPGAIVYWTTSNGTGLRGFHIGDESVTDIVQPTQAGTACVGCHSSTPDGTYVGFSASQNAGNGDPAVIELRSADGMYTAPPFITASAQALMNRTGQELPHFSANHWTAGDHTAIAMFTPAGDANSEIIWVDLEATAQDQNTGWGVITRSDGKAAGYASFAHTSDTIVYESAATVSSGVTVTDSDIATVPYGDRAGGSSSPVVGANTTTYNEFYPAFAPDDQLIAFDRVTTGQSSYNDAASEVFVIPAGGGSATRLAANDPPTCSGKVSPGVTNSFPKWSPGATTVGTRTFYWLTFSSTRGTGGNPQLYVAPVVSDGGVLTTYPALYLWNQPADENNHTPAWDNFNVPIQ